MNEYDASTESPDAGQSSATSHRSQEHTLEYRLVEEDFDQERAYRTVLYLSVFPTSFFLAAAYNESLFLCFSLLSFYEMRHGRWWLAGLFGFLAGLTRPV